MDREEVIKWLTIMKANFNSFPEVSNAKKIEALAEAIRLLKNEQSDKVDCDNTDCNNCINHKYCDYESNKSEIPTGSTTKNDLGADNQNIRLIDANALIKRLRPKHFDWWGEGEQDDFGKGNNSMLEEVIEAIEEFPSVTPIRPKDCPLKEVSNGEWLTDTQMLDETGYKYKCSNCGYGSMEDYEFCPQCGSDNRDD